MSFRQRHIYYLLDLCPFVSSMASCIIQEEQRSNLQMAELMLQRTLSTSSGVTGLKSLQLLGKTLFLSSHQYLPIYHPTQIHYKSIEKDSDGLEENTQHLLYYKNISLAQ